MFVNKHIRNSIRVSVNGDNAMCDMYTPVVRRHTIFTDSQRVFAHHNIESMIHSPRRQTFSDDLLASQMHVSKGNSLMEITLIHFFHHLLMTAKSVVSLRQLASTSVDCSTLLNPKNSG